VGCRYLDIAKLNKTLTSSHIGDTAVALLKAGAATDKKEVEGNVALDLAPDKGVCSAWST